MLNDDCRSIDTKLIHGGIDGDKYTGAVNIPIYQTATYSQETPGVFNGYEYSRTGNPTREALEYLIRDLEGGDAGFAFSSGMAAVTSVFGLFKAGDKFVVSEGIYGGTYRLLDEILSRFDLDFISVDTSDLDAVEAAIDDDVKAIFIETPTNPLLGITDLREIAKIAKRHGILSIVDNTFFTPYIQRPIEYGIDIVIHSATKYLGGHSDLIAGLVVTSDKEISEKLMFIQNTTGGILSPFDSFLLIRGIKTLGVRLDKQVANAKKLAVFLKNFEHVDRVYYPGLESHDGYDVNKSQASCGGAVISFEVAKDVDTDTFFKSLEVIRLAESLGGVESLVCQPWSMTHLAMPEKARIKAGIQKNLIRFSVGIENADDLKKDLKQALISAYGGKSS